MKKIEKFVFENEDDESEQQKQVMAYFGQAIYYAQVIEPGMANLIVLNRMKNGLVKSQSQHSRTLKKYLGKTFGALLTELKKKYPLKEGEKELLKNLRKRRNHITHDYFKVHVDKIYTQKGREWVINDLINYRIFFKTCNDLLLDQYHELSQKSGFTQEMYAQEFNEFLKEANTLYSDIKYNEDEFK